MKKFYKMQGAGNDYIFFDCFEEKIPDPAAAAIKYSNRHFGVGGDGIILIHPSHAADARMEMYNSDGSEGAMCGNGVRCVAKFLHDEKKLEKTVFFIETRSGIKRVDLKIRNGRALSASVEMGQALFDEKLTDALYQFDGENYEFTYVSMGNPHCVIFVRELDFDISKIGPLFERLPVFPDGANVEFVRAESTDSLKMRVWERGSGETLSCGSGACAAVCAALKKHLLKSGVPIKVYLSGGEYLICVDERWQVVLNGDCRSVFYGYIE